MKGLIDFFTLNRAQIVFGILGFIAVLGLVAGVYGKGVYDGKASCKAKQAAAAVQGVKTHAKVEHEVMALPDADLDRRLNKWLRD